MNVTVLALVATVAFVAGVITGGLLVARRFAKRRSSLWYELGLRSQDHGPLDPAETADVLEHWIGS